jgi:hypothetical protein
MKSADELSERSATNSDLEDESDEAEVVETRAAPKVDSNRLSDPMAAAESDSDEAEVVATRAAPKVDSNQLSDPMATAETDYLYGDDDSVATVDAGRNHLVQQKLSGKHHSPSRCSVGRGR